MPTEIHSRRGAVPGLLATDGKTRQAAPHGIQARFAPSDRHLCHCEKRNDKSRERPRFQPQSEDFWFLMHDRKQVAVQNENVRLINPSLANPQQTRYKIASVRARRKRPERDHWETKE
jgi:hypothetical protein